MNTEARTEHTKDEKVCKLINLSQHDDPFCRSLSMLDYSMEYVCLNHKHNYLLVHSEAKLLQWLINSCRCLLYMCYLCLVYLLNVELC